MSASDLYTAAVADVLDSLGLGRQTLPPAIGPLRQGMRLEGAAFAVEGEPRAQADHDASIRRILAMLGDVPPGAVAVYATHDEEAAQFGELSATALQAKGCPGVVLDGGCRDVGFIERAGFPVFCRYATPLDSVPRWHCAEWGHTVTIGGVEVATGDWLVADADGVIVVPAALRDEVLEKARAVAGTEDHVREAVRRGVAPLDAYDEFGKF
ncbi:MAG TPA: RraA family protein [Gaiellaceae bacterium]|nr:RraA family protein [Gaiellaceae bacterium]